MRKFLTVFALLGVMLFSTSGIASAIDAECATSSDGKHHFQWQKDGDQYYGSRRECYKHENEGCFWVQIMQDYEYKCRDCGDVKRTKQKQEKEIHVSRY